MTSIHGTDPSYDMRHMYDVADLKDPRGGEPPQTIHEDSLLFAMMKNTSCLDFYKIVLQNPYLAAELNDPQTRKTLFVPIVDTFAPADLHASRKHILAHIVPHVHPLSLLKTFRDYYLNTSITGARIRIQCDPEKRYPMINGSVSIVGHVHAGQSMIYLIDQALTGGSNPVTFRS